MKCIILANGEYGKLDTYDEAVLQADLILCADGGANYAYKMGVLPSYIIGDMDSILPEVKDYFLANDVIIKKYPQKKDFTDIQLALSAADELGAEEIVLLGTLGKRLDHFLSNLYCGIELAQKGRRIVHYSPECTVYLVTRELKIEGREGDIVSVIALSEEARGVYEEGFDSPLADAVLEQKNPYTISNVLVSETGTIGVEEGVLAVFHYRK